MRTNEELLAHLMGRLDKTYTLVYADRGDRLTNDQQDALARGDWESLWASIDEWYHDAQWPSIDWEREDLVKAELDDDEREQFENSDEWGELGLAIQERDDSNWLKDVCGHNVLLRVRASECDDIVQESFNPRTWAADCGVEPTPHNLEQITDALNECVGRAITPFWLFTVNECDLYELHFEREEARLRVRNPHLLFEDAMAGTGMECKVEHTEILHREHLRSDRDQVGYSWDELCGLPAFAVDTEIVMPPSFEPEAVCALVLGEAS